MERLIIDGGVNDGSPTPVKIWMPGDPGFESGITGKVNSVVLGPDGKEIGKSEFEGLEPQDIFEKLLEQNDRDITQIDRLPEPILAEVQKPARERKMMSIQERKDSTDPFSEVIFEANINGEPFYTFEEEFREIAKTLPSEAKIPYIVQTKPQWTKVFFHPAEGHQIATQQ